MKRLTVLIWFTFTIATSAAIASPSKIMFLCAGNYYRSRLAEAVFNSAARARGLDWRATSRALKLRPLNPFQQKRRLSPYTRAELKRLSIPLTDTGPEPVKARRSDVDQADCMIAMSEREHRPMFEAKFRPSARFPVVYWHHDDVRDARPDVVMPAIVAEVRQLVDDLAAGKGPDACEGAH